MKDTAPELTPELLMHAYSVGVFPMAESREDPEIFWVDPKRRGVIPLHRFHVSRSLARRLRKTGVSATLNTCFGAVLEACADRSETWINNDIAQLYLELFSRGKAHSIEVWYDGRLAGGVFGVTLGGAFFGESMFSCERDGSKVALACLVQHLRDCGFRLFDTQFITPHLMSLGAEEISRAAYHARLDMALKLPADIRRLPFCQPQDVAQRNTQIS